MTLTTTEIALSSSLIAVLGILCGHWLSASRDLIAREAILDREADIRRRTFLKVLHVFRGCMERTDHKRNDLVWEKYIELVVPFRGDAALVGGDFKKSPEFAPLIRALSEMRCDDLRNAAKEKGKDTRDVICDAIDALIRFCDAPK